MNKSLRFDFFVFRLYDGCGCVGGCRKFNLVGVGVLKTFYQQRISHSAVQTSLEKQLNLRGPVASRGWS